MGIVDIVLLFLELGLVFGTISGAILGVQNLASGSRGAPLMPLAVTTLSVGTLALVPPGIGLFHLFFGSPAWMGLAYYALSAAAALTVVALLCYAVLPPRWSKMRSATVPIFVLIGSLISIGTAFEMGRWAFLLRNREKLEAFAVRIPPETDCYEMPREELRSLDVVGINGVESCPGHIAFTYDSFDDVPGFLLVRPDHVPPTIEDAVFGLHIGNLLPVAPPWYWFFSCGCSASEPH